MNTASLRALAPALAALLLAVVCAVVLVQWSAQRATEAAALAERERAVRDDMRARLARVDEERRTIEQYASPYQRLRMAGIVGPEQRVAWIDALRIASQTSRGFGADYRLSAQQPARLRLPAPGVAVRESVMDLRLSLLHEGDLIAFLDALRQQQAGFFLPASCELTRLAGGPFNARFEPKLAADCQLLWLTLDALEEGGR